MYPAKKEKIIHEKVLEILKNNPKGLTMTELVKNTKFSRKAIEKQTGKPVVTPENNLGLIERSKKAKMLK